MEYFYDREKETLPKEQLQQLQLERLQKTVKYVYDRVKTYRKKMQEAGIVPEDIKTLKDITKLPFTVKQDLRDAYPFGMLAVDKKDIVRLHASSGTTGKLTVVGYTANDLDMWAQMMARALAAIGANQDSIVHNAFGYGLFTGGLGVNYGAEKLGATIVPISSGNTKRQLLMLKDFEADVLTCTPSYAVYLAEQMKKEGMSTKDLNLKIGMFGAEPWSEELKQKIESGLNLKAYDIYGLSEIMGPGVAFNCIEQCGMHIQEDNFFVEVVDKDTLEPVADGELGELVITTLTKEGLPLVRYRTRDITYITHEKCKCGRTFARIGKIMGRTDDMLIIRGVNVFPSQIESVLMSAENGVLPYYQIVVDRVNDLDVFQIDVEVKDEILSDSAKALSLMQSLTKEMFASLLVNPKINFVAENTLPRVEGKSCRVVDRR